MFGVKTDLEDYCYKIKKAMNVRSNEPFWLVKNGIQHSYPSLRTNISCDVLIMGSGITGSLMAHACVEKGYDTVLIDKREVANGSTSATTSMLQYEIDVPLYLLKELIGDYGATGSYLACRAAIYKLEDIIGKIGSACGFERKESLYFAGRRKDVKWLMKEFEARKEAGIEVRWMDKKEINEAYGIVAEGGILSADGASIDAFVLTHDLLHYNSQKGLKVFDKTELKKVKYGKNNVKVNVDTGAELTAKRVIYCTGYEAQAMLPERIVNLKSTYAMISEKNDRHPDICEKTLFWNTDNPYLYMRTTEEGRLLVGGADENFKNADRRDMLLDRKRNQLLKSLHRYLPKATFIEDFCWAGTFGETKDGLPYIGMHPKFPQSYFVLGFGGNGITFSVIGMDIVTGMMEGKPDVLSHFFRFGR